MTYGTNLRRSRDGTLNFRFVVPKDLRELVGRGELSVSLGTASKRAAALVCLQLQLEVKRFVEAARTAVAMNFHPDTSPALRQLLIRRLDIAKDHELRDANEQIWVGKADADLQRRKAVELLQKLQEADAHRGQQKVAIKHQETTIDRLRKTVLAIAEGPTNVLVPSAPCGPLLSAAIEAYKVERRATDSWQPKTSAMWDYRLRLLLEWFGDVPVSSISRQQMAEYLSALKRLPRNAEKIKLSAGQGMRVQTQLTGMPCIADRTVNLFMDCVSALFGWMDNEKSKWNVSGNIAKGLKISKVDGKKRIPFSDADLRLMLTSLEWESRSFLHSYHYWLIVLGLFTGARINELCQIELADFSEAYGHPILSLCTEGQRAKNENARRIVPLHPELIRLGLLRHVERLQHEGKKRLFPECTDKRDGHGQDASKWFGKFKRRVGISDASKVFHSTRHAFISQLLDRGVDSATVAALVGHAGKGESCRTYWNLKDAERFIGVVNKIAHPVITELVPDVEQVRFGVDAHRHKRRPPLRRPAPVRGVPRAASRLASVGAAPGR